jgi:hypothetical protein
MVSHSRLAWCGMLLPTMVLATGASASMNRPGKIPTTRQSAARKTRAARDHPSLSLAEAATGVRARPRKLTPNSLTKQAAASAAASASNPPTAGMISFSPHEGSCGLKRIA